MAAFFLFVLIVASGSFFGMKVARAHRGEPWNASRTFKSNLSLIGPYGVSPKGRIAGTRPAPPRPLARQERPVRRSAQRGPRRGSVSSLETLQFVLALCLAASCFTVLLALAGMLPWEFALGTVAATGLFLAGLLERRSTGRRTGPRARRGVSYLNRIPELDEYDETYAAGGYG